MKRPIPSFRSNAAEPDRKPELLRSKQQPGAGTQSLITKWLTALDWRRIGTIFSIILIVAVWIILYRLVKDVSWDELLIAIKSTTFKRLVLAVIASAASYVALAGYDVLALRQVGATQISLAFTAFTSFIAQAFTFTLGFGLLTGGFIRLRLYQSKGLQPSRVIAVGILCSATFWLGLAATGGVSLVLAPTTVAGLDGLSAWQNFVAGIVIIGALGVWAAYTGAKDRFIRVGSWDLKLPGPRLTILSTLCGFADAACAGFALWMLLPPDAAVSYPAFLIVFTAATLLGVVSNAPGGIGVFEAVIMLSLREAPQAGVLAALLVFRALYYLLPFSIAAFLFGTYEARRGTLLSARVKHAAAIAKPFIPAVTSISVFMGGFILLVSGALPALEERMAVLRRTVPLPFVETSHFLASIVGALLLVVASGLQQKLRSAWLSATVLLTAAAIFSLFKGIDYEESILCFVVIGLLAFGKSEFYRRGGLLEAFPSVEWIFGAAIAVGASIWIGAVIYHDDGYQNQLWWDFTYHGDESRFLRATLGVATVFLIVISYRFVHKPAAMGPLATKADLDKAAPIIAASKRAEANLAFLRDKRFLFNPAGTGFIMYGVQGRSWIAMGDPIVLPGESIAGLVWQFRELVDEYRGIPVFYQATTEHLPVYLDAGFSMAKLGEEAWVDLSTFTIEGKEGRRIRQAKAASERSEATLEIVKAADIGPLMPELKRVSDEWLAHRSGGEKGFSLGFWSEPYLRQYDHAVIRHFGEIVAFANIWTSADKQEFSVDLMRSTPNAPPGMMDLLFINLMEYAKAEGYHWFNLGMAPLSGMPDHRLANLWSRFASLVFRYGDRFYNFAGLRSFKNKFRPQWRPRYLAYPGGSLAKVLVDVTTLIARSPGRASTRQEANSSCDISDLQPRRA